MILQGNALDHLKTLGNDSIDAIITDPPYGYSFMNKDWDKAVIGVETWSECLRVLKPGAFAAIMSSPRQDVLSRMIVNLQDAGFRTDFTSLYHTYASGFPKAANVSKLVDKRGYENHRYSELSKELCDYLRSSRENLGLSQKDIAKYFLSKTGGLTGCVWNWENGANIPTLQQWNTLKTILKLENQTFNEDIERAILKREEAEREIISKEEMTFGIGGSSKRYGQYKIIDKSATDKAKELDGSYAGYQPKPALEVILMVMKPLTEKTYVDQALKNGKGVTWLDNCRIPFQDDSDKYKDGIRKAGSELGQSSGWNDHENRDTFRISNNKGRFPANLLVSDSILNSHSKYFDLDTWFINTPKAPPSERHGSTHPTQKPIKLMSYLVTLLTKEDDTVLDPFAGSGTTLLAAKMLNRKYIGIELNKEYVDIVEKRLRGIL